MCVCTYVYVLPVCVYVRMCMYCLLYICMCMFVYCVHVCIVCMCVLCACVYLCIQKGRFINTTYDGSHSAERVPTDTTVV